MNPDKGGVLTLLMVISLCAVVHLVIYLIYIA